MGFNLSLKQAEKCRHSLKFLNKCCRSFKVGLIGLYEHYLRYQRLSLKVFDILNKEIK